MNFHNKTERRYDCMDKAKFSFSLVLACSTSVLEGLDPSNGYVCKCIASSTFDSVEKSGSSISLFGRPSEMLP